MRFEANGGMLAVQDKAGSGRLTSRTGGDGRAFNANTPHERGPDAMKTRSPGVAVARQPSVQLANEDPILAAVTEEDTV